MHGCKAYRGICRERKKRHNNFNLLKEEEKERANVIREGNKV